MKTVWHVFSVLVLVSMCQGGEFSGGMGTASDPYQIATAQQLISIRSDADLLGKCFVLMCDIDLDPNLPGGRVFTKALIAPQVFVYAGHLMRGIPFDGCFDGQGHTIRNFTCRGDTTDMGETAGLFGAMDVNGVIQNLTVEGLDMTMEGFAHLGGLLGFNAGQVVHCNVEGALSGAGGVRDAAMGGLIGCNQGRVERCYTNMTLHHEGQALLGGLVGYNADRFQTFGEIYDAYALGTLQCLEPSALGGLVGRNDGRVARCYAATAVEGVSLPNRFVGSFVGRGDDNASFCYYRQVEGRPELDNGIGIALTDDQMRQPESFGAWEFYSTSPTGKNNHWFMSALEYPVLTWQSDLTGVYVIPKVSGLTEDKAASRLAEIGFANVTIYHEFDHRRPTGLAISTDPGLYASAGMEIGLYVSAGLYDWSGNPGSGSTDDPFQIENAGQLDALHARPDLWKANFQLQNDIDLKTRVYDKALLGFDEDLVENDFQGVFFQGHLDGQGHAIRNLTVQSPALGMYLGLVGYAGQEALVERLRLEDTAITVGQGSIYVGMVAGYNQGSITQCSIQGCVTAGESSLAMGGAVGFHAGSLSECQVESTLVVDAGYQGADNLGGLVGRNQGRVQSCRTVINLQCTGGRSNEAMGGIAGHNAGEIHNCYVWGSINVSSDDSDFGQLVGRQSEGGSYSMSRSSSGILREINWQDTLPTGLSHCYAALDSSGKVPNEWDVGRIDPGGEVTHCLWDRQAWRRHYSSHMGVGLTTGDMKDPEMLALNGWSQDPNWVLNPGQDYPRLAWEGTPGQMISGPAMDWLEGDGTPDRPYLIRSEGVLSRIANASLLWDRCFSLEADLDLADWVWPGWGRNKGAGFSGTLAGNGHIIRNLTIDLMESGGFNVGLFGYVTESARVNDLVLIDCSIASEGTLTRSGCLAGYNGGALLNCSVSGIVTGGGWCQEVGVVVGYNEGEIFLCQGEGSVSTGERASAIGGAVGENNGTVIHSQSLASVTVGSWSQSVGGLAGNNSGSLVNTRACGAILAAENARSLGGLAGSASGRITHSYACNSVNALDPYERLGGLVGSAMPDSVSEAYFVSDGTDVDLDNGIGTVLSEAEMRVQSSFQGWDFDNETAHGTIGIWRMPEGGGYPELSFGVTDSWTPGALASPALISFAKDLRDIYYHPLDAFQLVENIDLAGIQWTTTPLPLFAGSLDGSGHAIGNLSVATTRNAGLFGYLAEGAHVFDLALENADLGLADVSDVVGTVAAVNEGSISRCVVRGRVQGDKYVGGLVGVNRGDVVDCYGTVALEAQRWSGGLVGHNDTGLIRRCYSNGVISETGNQWSVGPVVGYNYGSAFHCFWDKEVALNWSSQLGRGKTTDQMMRSETFGLNGWAGEAAWIIDDMQDYPRLSWEGTPGQTIPATTIDWFSGEGTEAIPYEIETPAQLVLLGSAGVLWDKQFVLTEDLDMAGHSLSPIGVCPGSGFSGRFDGQGHVIRNLKFPVDQTRSFYVGLFGQIESTGCVTDLRLEAVEIAFGDIGGKIGGLAGHSNGWVQRCGVFGTITGQEGWRVGGLVGENLGSIEESFADVDLEIVENSQAGGLVGYSEGDITNAYATGRINTGLDSVWSGGLIGLLSGGELTHGYARGFVKGGRYVGGLVGNKSYSNITGSYFLASEYGGGPDNALGMPLTRIAMSEPSSFEDWDFEGIWSACVGPGSPWLQWENHECVQPGH